MADAHNIREGSAPIRLADGMPLDISRHKHLVDFAEEELQGSHLSFPRQLAMAAASVQEAVQLLPDLADAILELLPNDTDSDKARAVLQGMKPFLNHLTDSGTKLAALALLAVAEGLPAQRTSVATGQVPGVGPIADRGKS